MSDGVSSSVVYTLAQYADILCNDNGHTTDASGNPIEDSEGASGVASGYRAGVFTAPTGGGTTEEEAESPLLSGAVDDSNPLISKSALSFKGQEPPMLYEEDNDENVQSVIIEDDHGRRVTLDSYRDRIVINDVNLSYANFMEILESLREPADADVAPCVSANFDDLKTVAAFAGTAGVLFAAVLSIWIYYILKAVSSIGN
jgi:hypothetical protein